MYYSVDDVELMVRFDRLPVDGEDEIRRCYVCEIFLPSEQMVKIGKAVCSRADNFCKATGRKLAFTRALLAAFPGPDNKGLRTEVWEQYLYDFPLK